MCANIARKQFGHEQGRSGITNPSRPGHGGGIYIGRAAAIVILGSLSAYEVRAQVTFCCHCCNLTTRVDTASSCDAAQDACLVPPGLCVGAGGGCGITCPCVCGNGTVDAGEQCDPPGGGGCQGGGVCQSDCTCSKRVIFVANNVESSQAEGYYRQNPQANDQFVREAAGQNITDAWGKVVDRNRLIIITHGTVGGGGIRLKGGQRDGFRLAGSTGTGTGAGCGDPLGLAKRTLNDVKVELKVCYSDTDPAGAPTTVTSTLLPLMNGARNTVTGKDGAVSFNVNLTYKAGTAAQTTATKNCLLAAAQAAGFATRINWVASMGYPDGQNAVNAAIQTCMNAGQDVIGANVTYDEPLLAVAAATRAIAGAQVETIKIAPCDDACEASPGEVPVLPGWAGIALAGLLCVAGMFVFGNPRKESAT